MQLELFAGDSTTEEIATGPRAITALAPVNEAIDGTAPAAFETETAIASPVTVQSREPGVENAEPVREERPAEVECKMIISALRATSHEEFANRLEPLLTEENRERIALCKDLPYQLVNHAWNPIVERLNRRWGELEGGWQPFGRVVEPAEEMAGLRVMTLDLIEPSRGLEGQVAFAVSRRLHDVGQPIPLPVLEFAREACREGWFQAIAFLEPIFGPGRKNREIMRSQAQVQRTHARLIDPLVVGFLGAGPTYWLRERVAFSLQSSAGEYRPRAHRQVESRW